MKNNDSRDLVPKIIGADIELGNSEDLENSGRVAAERILAEIPGVQANNNTFHVNNTHGYNTGWAWVSQWRRNVSIQEDEEGFFNEQDIGRKFINNGGCAYIDMDHAEIALPETTSALAHVAIHHAGLRIVRRALEKANAKMGNDRKLRVFTDCTDRKNHSWGAHTNIGISRECFGNIFNKKLHHLLYLGSVQASMICITGGGKVGAENNNPRVDYQIGQRPDFIETILGWQTTYNRPLVNCRDEPLSSRFARLHCISMDHALSHRQILLKVGILQITTAMLEDEFLDPNLIFVDPVKAISEYSNDPSLNTEMKTIDGREYSIIDHQLACFRQAERFASRVRLDDIVPDWHYIMTLWEETLLMLKKRDFISLAGCLDWVMKKHILDEAASTYGFTYDSPEMRIIDRLFSALNPDTDPDQGLFWLYEKQGQTEKLVSDERIESYMDMPPSETRAWLRAEIVRHVQQGDIGVTSMDWHEIRYRDPGFKVKRGNITPVYRYYKFDMGDPCAQTRSQCERILREAPSFTEALSRIGGLQETNFAGVNFEIDNSIGHACHSGSQQ